MSRAADIRYHRRKAQVHAQVGEPGEAAAHHAHANFLAGADSCRRSAVSRQRAESRRPTAVGNRQADNQGPPDLDRITDAGLRTVLEKWLRVITGKGKAA